VEGVLATIGGSLSARRPGRDAVNHGRRSRLAWGRQPAPESPGPGPGSTARWALPLLPVLSFGLGAGSRSFAEPFDSHSDVDGPGEVVECDPEPEQGEAEHLGERGDGQAGGAQGEHR
jgi:hypothetical protein